MTLNNLFNKVRISKLALLLVCFIAQSAIALADNKLYVADVTIAPDNNDPVDVAICLDNDVSGVTSLSMNIELPTGLEFVETNYMGQKIISATASSRANGASIIGNPKTGKTSVVCMSGINAGTGPIFTFKVKPNANLGSLGTIKLTNAQMKTSTETYSVANNNLTVENGKVVKPSTMSVAFGETDFYMEAAATHSVAVSMNKNLLTTVNGFQADVTLPAGWTATITNGIITNSGKGTRVMSTTSFSDEDGPLFTINLKAPADFGEGPVTVKLENIYVTVGFVEEILNPIELTINPTDLKADVEAANAKVAELKTAAAALAVSAEAKAYDNEVVKAAVADAETAIAGVNTAITAVEAKIAEHKISTENKEALAAAIAAAEKAIADAKTAIAAAEKAYTDAKDAEAAAVEAANAKVAELKTAAEALTISAEAKGYEAENVKTAVADAETAIAAVNPAIAAIETKIAEGKLSTDNKEALAAVIAAAEKAIADAKTAIATAEKTYADQKAADDAAEAAAVEAANTKLAELKTAAEALAISAEAKAYEAENVQAKVAAAETAIAAANTAIAAVEAVIAEGKLSTDNKDALATAIATAETKIADAQTAINLAQEAYVIQKAADDAEAAAVEAANTKVAELKTAAAALAVSAEAKAYEAENVQAKVAAAETAIAAANTAIAAVEAVIAEGKLSTDNKDALATAIATAETKIADAQTAINLAQEAYVIQKAADDAEAAAVEAANTKVAELKTAAAALAVSAEAKAYEAENVQAKVAAAETAIAAANTAIAAVEAVIAEGKLSTDNKDALATAIATAETKIADAQTAINLAQEAYVIQKAADDAEAAAVEAANTKVAELKTAAEALTISAEAKAYEAENVKTAVAAAETAIAAVNPAIAAVEAKIAEGKLSTDNKEALAAAIATAEKAIADAKTAIAAAEKAYADQKAIDDAAEAGAKASAEASVTSLKVAMEEVVILEAAKAYDAENVKAAVAAAEQAIAKAEAAIKAVEDLIAEGKLATDNKEAVARAILAAQKAVDAAADAAETANETYKQQRTDEEAAVDAANAKVTELKAAAAALAISEEAKAYEAENVQAAVADAEAAIAAVTPAIAAIEAVIAEGHLAEANKEALAAAIAAAEKAIADAQTAINLAEEAYVIQKAKDEADAAEAAAKTAAETKVAELKTAAEALVVSEEAKAYEAENVQAKVADAETAIAAANTAIAAVEAVIAEGKLSTDNKEALATAIAEAEQAIATAQTAIQLAEEAYVMQKAADEAAAALAAAKTALEEAITAAKAVSVEGMTAESVQALNDAIAAAEAALAAEDATVESLNAAKADLEAAVKGLVLAPVFADGTYYLYNPASGKYMAAGSSWGTHAVINEAGLDYILTYTATDGKYTIDSQVSNGGNSHFLNGEWNDGAAMGWIFAKTAEGEFTISNGSAFLTVQENGEVLLKDDATSAAAQWTLVTKADRDAANLATLGAASAENGVDATFLITGANYNRNDLRNAAWTGDGFSVGGDATNTNAEKWGGNSQTFDIHQTIELPNGIYKVTWNGFYRYNNTTENTNDVAAAAHAEGTEVINSFVYLNDTDIALTSIADEAAVEAFGKMPFSQGDASAAFGQGLYEQTAEVTVEEGTLTIGIKKIEHLGTDWTVWDNFRLTYFGEATVVNPDDDVVVAPEGWTNLVANGNLAGDLNANYFSKESPSSEIKTAAIVAGAGKNHSRGIVVKSADEAEGADAWNTQFWIKANQSLPIGTKLHVEFDYAASQAAKASTQSHGENPGQYIIWHCIGDVNFTTEWQHFSADVEVAADMANMQCIAFNLAEEKTATEYYFDNFGVWAQIPEPVQEWENLIVNSDIEGESMECFYVTEQGVGGPFVAIATEGIGKDGSKAVKVQSADDPDDPTTEETEGTDWDSQFFIRLPYQLPAGTKYKVSFDYKADKAGDFDTQAHANPGQYIHWAFCGSGSFTTEWQTYEAEGTVPSQCDGSSAQKTFQTIAFNLAKNRVATEFVFDNVKFFVPKDIVSSLTKNPDENPVHYPTGIKNVMNEMNAEGIFNLNGQKIQKTQKGLYIINGKKVVIK